MFVPDGGVQLGASADRPQHCPFTNRQKERCPDATNVRYQKDTRASKDRALMSRSEYPDQCNAGRRKAILSHASHSTEIISDAQMLPESQTRGRQKALLVRAVVSIRDPAISQDCPYRLRQRRPLPLRGFLRKFLILSYPFL